MKRAIVFAVLFGAGILFAFSGSSVAQQSPPTKNDVDRMVQKARETLAKTSYRETMVTNHTDPANNVNQTFGFTNSYIPTDKWHCEHYAKSGAKVSGSGEVIILGKDIFSRSGSQAWKRDASGGCESGTDSFVEFENEAPGIAKTDPEVSRRDVMLDEVPAQMFEVTIRHKFEKYDNVNIYVKSYWFDNDGKILKVVSENRSTRSKAMQRRTSVYKYISDFVIEAPIP